VTRLQRLQAGKILGHATVTEAPLNLQGCLVFKAFLDRSAQVLLLDEVRDVTRAAPLRRYATRRGQMSVAMSAAGALGWVSDRRGYRYESAGPAGPWPEIPGGALAVWRAVAGVACDPDSCLVNFYGEGARMGMHQDRDEADTNWPVVSISLGDPALFRVGGVERKTPTESVWLESGDVAVLAGDARLAWHGIDRIRFGASSLLQQGGRINLTLRVAGQGTRLQQPV
jgi:alkylated DNA repair protein (DNA oxidative demethylase)